LPASVRTALDAAVKRGDLGYLKRNGLKPAVYFHPTFRYLAVAERKAAEDRAVAALRRVAGCPEEQA
jgi:CDP-glycerol glycerophosphotransferase (TagB/SpsB family)